MPGRRSDCRHGENLRDCRAETLRTRKVHRALRGCSGPCPAYCQAADTLHSPGIMFAGYQDEVESPTAADDGVFIPQKELVTWWKGLQKKYPGVYPPDEVRTKEKRNVEGLQRLACFVLFPDY